MGLLRRVAMLPLAPVEGLLWLARVLEELAEEELNDPERLRAMLEEAEMAHRRGEISDEELASIEDEILDRLMPAPAGDELVPRGAMTDG